MADHPNEDRDSSDTVMTVADVQSRSDIDSKSKLKDAFQAG
jgi:hypothetical protein